jgi:hypothetical protein
MYQLWYLRVVGGVTGKRSRKKRVRGCTRPEGGISSPEPPWMSGVRCQSTRWHLFGSEICPELIVYHLATRRAGTNNYALAPKPLQPVRFGDRYTLAVGGRGPLSRLQPPSVVIWSETC